MTAKYMDISIPEKAFWILPPAYQALLLAHEFTRGVTRGVNSYLFQVPRNLLHELNIAMDPVTLRAWRN